MEEVISFIKRFNKTVRIVEHASEVCVSNNAIPVYWREAFACSSREDRIERILQEWRKYPLQLGKITAFLTQRMINVFLIERQGVYSLLYLFENSNEEQSFYEGRIPIEPVIQDERVKELWKGIPSSILDVYVGLHNGWVYYPSQSNGLSPIEDLAVLGEEEWGILEELENADTYAELLNRSIGFFHNGGGAYLSIDMQSVDNEGSFIWFHDCEPKLGLNFWMSFNAWFFASIDEDYSQYINY